MLEVCVGLAAIHVLHFVKKSTFKARGWIGILATILIAYGLGWVVVNLVKGIQCHL